MPDHLLPDERSKNMSKIRATNTGPELAVRKMAHSMGLRFRLHRKDLPGKPDIVFPRYRLVVFVHGCFWHQHEGCSRATVPATRQDFWHRKFQSTKERDARQVGLLREQGWRVLCIWECELKRPDEVRATLNAAIQST